MEVADWQEGVTYYSGQVVVHKGEAYTKLDDNDQSEPDHIAGGWALIEDADVAQYKVIADSLSTYEERVRNHKADILAKLQAAGLDPADVLAVLQTG